MKPETALELVGRYARLTREIKACAARIGAELDKCEGLRGFRLETEHHPEQDAGPLLGVLAAYDEPTERASKDQDTHLKTWYEHEGYPVGYDDWQRFTVGEDEEQECPHCYAAHLIVQERKELRRKLAGVKAAMTRHG